MHCAGKGLSTQQIFKHVAPQELVDRLSVQCSQAALLPPGTSPHAVATLLKQFLLGLPEPLLTYRCCWCCWDKALSIVACRGIAMSTAMSIAVTRRACVHVLSTLLSAWQVPQYQALTQHVCVYVGCYLTGWLLQTSQRQANTC